jgi:hypothetical protein
MVRPAHVQVGVTRIDFAKFGNMTGYAQYASQAAIEALTNSNRKIGRKHRPSSHDGENARMSLRRAPYHEYRRGYPERPHEQTGAGNEGAASTGQAATRLKTSFS